ncbi:protein YnhH [Kosakonia sp. BK9b]
MNCKTNNSHQFFPDLAESQAHITLHAFLMSPILSLWHRSFRNTGLTPEPCATRSVISISFSTQT